MSASNNQHYNKVHRAIQYLEANFQHQPSLDDIAAHVHLSPFHFQKVFSEWAGVSPKKYLQYLSLHYAKTKLRDAQLSLDEAASATGLSGSSRLHDLFINIEGMTPSEYKLGGANLSINYSFAETPFGKVIIASTAKGICLLQFCINEAEGLALLQQEFPQAALTSQQDAIQNRALAFFQHPTASPAEIKLHLKASEFQLKVWSALLHIPAGNLQSYGDVAKQLGNHKASRAVGTAIGHNPVALLIPCHRVIQASGQMGGYRWGTTRKKAIIGWESAKYSGD